MSQAVAIVLTEEERARIRQKTGLTDFEINIIANARDELSRAVLSFWNSPAGRAVKKALSRYAHSSGFAGSMEDIMSNVKAQIEAAARQADLKTGYKSAWAKPY